MDAKQLAREKRNRYMAEWRLTDAGRKNTEDNIEKRSDVRRGIAAAKRGVMLVKPSEFDATSVQRALNIWGGL